MLGTTDGQLVVLNSSGVLLSQSTLVQGVEVCSMRWPGEKFKFSDDVIAHDDSSENSTEPNGNEADKSEGSSGCGGSMDSGVRVDSLSSLNSESSTGR